MLSSHVQNLELAGTVDPRASLWSLQNGSVRAVGLNGISELPERVLQETGSGSCHFLETQALTLA